MKKLTAPIIITLIIIGYLIFGMTTMMTLMRYSGVPMIIYIMTLIIPVGAGIGILLALVKRIKEVKRGEENDISKY